MANIVISKVNRNDGYAILESAENQPHLKVSRAEPCKLAGENLVLASLYIGMPHHVPWLTVNERIGFGLAHCMASKRPHAHIQFSCPAFWPRPGAAFLFKNIFDLTLMAMVI